MPAEDIENCLDRFVVRLGGVVVASPLCGEGACFVLRKQGSMLATFCRHFPLVVIGNLVNTKLRNNILSFFRFTFFVVIFSPYLLQDTTVVIISYLTS